MYVVHETFLEVPLSQEISYPEKFLVARLNRDRSTLQCQEYTHIIIRGSLRRCSLKTLFLNKNFPKFTAEKFKNFTKIARNFSKNRLLHSCFPVKLAIILRTSFLLNISRLLLYRANCIIIKCRFLISETTIAITSEFPKEVLWLCD